MAQIIWNGNKIWENVWDGNQPWDREIAKKSIPEKAVLIDCILRRRTAAGAVTNGRRAV